MIHFVINYRFPISNYFDSSPHHSLCLHCNYSVFMVLAHLPCSKTSCSSSKAIYTRSNVPLSSTGLDPSNDAVIASFIGIQWIYCWDDQSTLFQRSQQTALPVNIRLSNTDTAIVMRPDSPQQFSLRWTCSTHWRSWAFAISAHTQRRHSQLKPPSPSLPPSRWAQVVVSPC